MEICLSVYVCVFESMCVPKSSSFVHVEITELECLCR